MTSILETPATQRTGHDLPMHWCCVTQTDLPLFGLCGDLLRTQRRQPGARITCPACLDVVHGHVADCGRCRPFASVYL